jgi:hypothetical protein
MPSTKFQINSNHQSSRQDLFGHLKLEFGDYLACLREAAAAKAGIWNL